jgi:hypothetical protein
MLFCVNIFKLFCGVPSVTRKARKMFCVTKQVENVIAMKVITEKNVIKIVR